MIHRLLIAASAALLLSSTASAYYHYIHFNSRVAPFSPMPEKYDVNSLRNKTVYYYISEQGPAQQAANDTLIGLMSQIRLAAKVWNDVPSSDLRIAFGGIASPNTPQDGPGIDISFSDDIPPGVWAMGGVASVAAPVTPANGAPFVPIVRGLVRMPRDLRDMPSFTERGFMITLHELGHSLGLQHTFTSSTMSTEITRATTRSRPLSDDDVAAISILYPTGNFLAQTGSVTGRVTMGGAGANMASVVAISASGPAVSTLTNPDGTYTLQGIPPGNYYLYVHPLPPALNGETSPGAVVPPKGPDSLPIGGPDSFDTQFYPGTRDPNGAMAMPVAAGEVKQGFNFAVQRKAQPDVSSVTTYGYYGSVAVSPAPVVGTTNGTVLVARGSGLVTSTNALAPGLSVRTFGDSGVSIEPTSVKYYTAGYIRFDLYPGGYGWSPGPRHLLFSTRDDLYVLPSSLLLVANQGPSISSIRSSFDEKAGRVVQISGSNFDSSTRVFFDGVQAQILRNNPDGSLIVVPPPAPGGYKANVIAANGDGQSSLFSQPGGGPSYTYEAADAPSISIAPASFQAGQETMVEITGVNTSFAEGQTVIGFGTSSIAVRKVWVMGPNRILANVSIAIGAQASSSNLTVVTGLQTASLPSGIQIVPLPPTARGIAIVPPAVNSMTGASSVASGGFGLLNVVTLNSPASALTLTVGGQRAVIQSVSNGQIAFQAPTGLPAGPAIVRLQIQGAETVAPVLIDIEIAPPSIQAVYSTPGGLADPFRPAARGSQIGVLVSGLPDSVVAGETSGIRINVGGIDHTPVSATTQSGGVLVQISLSNSIQPGAQVPLYLTYGAVSSQTVTIPVR